MNNTNTNQNDRIKKIRQSFADEVSKKESKEMQARNEQERSAWFGLGMFGLVGWSVAIPTLLGVAIGIWVDKTVNSRFSWTLMLLFIGVILGCLNAWYWVKRESNHD
jgi:ATP synthase protein I